MQRRPLVLMLIVVLLGATVPASANHVNDKLGPTNSVSLHDLGMPLDCQAFSVKELHTERFYSTNGNAKRALWDSYYARTTGVCSFGLSPPVTTAGCLFTDQANWGAGAVTLCWWPDPANPPPVKPMVVHLNAAAYQSLAAQVIGVGPNSPFPAGALTVNVHVTGQGIHTVHLLNGKVQKVVTNDKPAGCTKVDYQAYRWAFNKSPYMANNREQMDKIDARTVGLCLSSARLALGDCTHVVDLGSYLIPGRGYTWACFYGEVFKPSTLSFGPPVVAAQHTGGAAPDFEIWTSQDMARTILNAPDPRATALAALADGRIVIKANDAIDQMKINAVVKGGKDKLRTNEPTCGAGSAAPGGGTWEIKGGVLVRTSAQDDLVYNRLCSPIGARSTHHDHYLATLPGAFASTGLGQTPGILGQSPRLLNGVTHAAPRTAEIHSDLLSLLPGARTADGADLKARLGALNPIWSDKTMPMLPGTMATGKETAFGLGATSSSYMRQTLSQQGLGSFGVLAGIPATGGDPGA